MKFLPSEVKEDIDKVRGDVGIVRDAVGKVQDDVGQVRDDVGKVRDDVGQVRGDVGKMQVDMEKLKNTGFLGTMQTQERKYILLSFYLVFYSRKFWKFHNLLLNLNNMKQNQNVRKDKIYREKKQGSIVALIIISNDFIPFFQMHS